jgi:hypothetical protein
MNGLSRYGIGRRMLISTACLGLLLGLSGCYPDGAFLRSCYHADATCGWNNDHGNRSESSPSPGTPGPATPGPATPGPGPGPT